MASRVQGHEEHLKGLGGVFAAYGAVCFCGVLFVRAIIPETKGKTFEEIQKMLGGGRYTNIN